VLRGSLRVHRRSVGVSGEDDTSESAGCRRLCPRCRSHVGTESQGGG
jgi:hypothetical protein